MVFHLFFVCNVTATTDIYTYLHTLSLHDALPICYGQFEEIAWGRIKINLIRENWSDLIRLAGSIKLGHLKAAGVMRMLQVKDRPTTLAKALSELGRIIKTLHILRYIDEIGRAHV